MKMSTKMSSKKQPKMTGGAAGGLGRIEKSAAAPKNGAGKMGKAL